MTVPHCPLVSERSDDWPRRLLAKNRCTPCSRDCLTGAVFKHHETNTRRQPTGTHRCDSKLPIATTWYKYIVISIIPKPCKRSSVNANIASLNSLCVFTSSVTRINFAPGPPWPVKRCQQTLKLVYITHNLTTLMICHDTLKYNRNHLCKFGV